MCSLHALECSIQSSDLDTLLPGSVCTDLHALVLAVLSSHVHKSLLGFLYKCICAVSRYTVI
jgi:hypothetical protein